MDTKDDKGTSYGQSGSQTQNDDQNTSVQPWTTALGKITGGLKEKPKED